MTAHKDIRQMLTLATGVVNRVPGHAAASSARDAETRLLRATQGGGGVARAEMLDRLNADAQVMVGHLALVVGGVADALEISSQRDHEVNTPALCFAVRPALELAGQIIWLLKDSLDAEQRARRYVVWYLGDLRSQRLLVKDFQMPGGPTEAVLQELDSMEREILTAVDAAKWLARQTTYRGEHLEAAVLLDSGRKQEQMPKLGELAHLVSSTPGMYGLLSATSHSQRFGVMAGLAAHENEPAGSTRVTLSGLPLETNLLIGLTVLAVNIPTGLLGGWNGVDVRQLQTFSSQLLSRARLS